MERYQGREFVIVGGTGGTGATSGATNGIGLATAEMLIDGGAHVLVTGRSQAGLAWLRKYWSLFQEAVDPATTDCFARPRLARIDPKAT